MHLLLIDMAYRGSVLLLLLLAIYHLGQRQSAALRSWVLAAGLAALAVLTLLVWMVPEWRVLPGSPVPLPQVKLPEERLLRVEANPEFSADAKLKAQVAMVTQVAKPSSPTKAQAQASTWPTLRWEPVLLSLWMLGTLVCLGRLVVSATRLLFVELRAGEASAPLRESVQSIAAEIGLKRLPKILLGGPGPMVWGLFRGCLLLPPSADRRSVLLHELTHLKRRDPAVLLLAQLVAAVHWFNPLVWLALCELRAMQEASCDDAVLRAGTLASGYAQELLDASAQLHEQPSPGWCALAFTRGHPVERRVRDILSVDRVRSAPRWIARVAAVLVAMGAAMPLALVAKGEPPRGRILDRYGRELVVQEGKQRSHPFGALAAHALGYTRSVNGRGSPRAGVSGVERSYNDDLAAGRDLRLALDARVQAIAELAMNKAGVGRGAVVVMDPRNGDVLASVSVPNFMPDVFEPMLKEEDWGKIRTDPCGPLLDRTQALYAPGSGFKVFTSLAAGLAMKELPTLTCEGSSQWGGKLLKCWIAEKGGKHGPLNLSDALTSSCNCYFYQLSQSMRPTHFLKTGRMLGWDTGDRPAVVFGDEFEHHNSEWHKANCAIGQGEVRCSPLQLCGLAATVANGGTVWKPRWNLDAEPEKLADFQEKGVAAETLKAIRQGMYGVVNGEKGTGKRAQTTKALVAGMTGTSQFWQVVQDELKKDNHVWFTGFAPFDQPRLAFAVFVQGGKSGGSVCAPIAGEIMEQALGLAVDGSGEVLPTPVVMGHLRSLEGVPVGR
jgi:beta-lactamase regulating signal transducer with metallopeptidase domain